MLWWIHYCKFKDGTIVEGVTTSLSPQILRAIGARFYSLRRIA